MTGGAALFLRIVFGLAGIMCIVFGYLIGVKKRVDLIAGYKPEKCKDPAGLAKFFCIWVSIIGVFTILYPWVYGPPRTTPLLWLLYYCIPVVVIAVIMIVGSSRYEHKPSK